jgi:hypothetical protein
MHIILATYRNGSVYVEYCLSLIMCQCKAGHGARGPSRSHSSYFMVMLIRAFLSQGIWSLIG